MKAAEDDPDDACIEEKRIIDDNHCHAIKDVPNESLSNESFLVVADEKQCRIKSEYQDYHISVRFSNIEYTMTRITKDQMSSDNRCQGKCVKKDVNLENKMDWHLSDTPKLSSNITKEENNLSKDDAENGCNYSAVYTQESSASIGYSKAVSESRSLGLMPSENSECLESLQNSSLLGDPKPCLNESYGSEFDKDEIATEKLDVNSGEIPASGISDENSTIWLTESRMLTRSSTQTDLTSFNIPVHGTDENVRENTNLFRNLHWSAERGLQSCSDLQLLDMESVAHISHSFACTCHNLKSELSPVGTSLNALNVESLSQNSLSMCRDAVSLNSIRQLYRNTNFSSDFGVFTGTLDSFSPLSLQREKSESLLSLGLRQSDLSLSLDSLQSATHQQELDQVASSNCMCNCNERSRLSASFWKTDELMTNKDGGEIGTSKDAEKSIESRESEIGPCGYNGTIKIDRREKTKPLDNDGISAGDANAFVNSSKKNCYQSEQENGIHMAVKLHPDDEMPFVVNKATEEMLDDTEKIKSKESEDTSQQMGKQRIQITSRATDIRHILKLIMFFFNYFQENDHESLDGEVKNYADLCKLYMETENEGINCNELSHEKIWLSSTRNKECFPKATPKECQNDEKCIIVPFSRAMHHVDWKMSSNVIAHKNEKMNEVNLHYRLNKTKEKSIVYFTACENQHLFGPRAIFWLQFLDDHSEKYHNEFRYLLQRFCPWIIMPISLMTLDGVDNDCFCIHNPFKYTSLLRKEVKYSTKNEESHFLCLPPAISANSQKLFDAQDNNDPCNCAPAVVERNFTHSQSLQKSKPKLPRDSKKSDSKCATNCVPTKPYVSKNTNNNRSCIIQTQYTKPRKYLKKEVKKTQPTLMKNKLIREKRTREKRLTRSVNSMMADFTAKGEEVTNSINGNSAMKPMTSDSFVFILELRSHSNERKKLFKHQLELNDSRKEEIRRHLVRFYKEYESTKHGRSESISLVSMEKIDSLSLPEMVFKIQSIPKGLGSLRRYLRISEDFKIASIETVLPLQQANQQPQEGLESVSQPLDNETRTESEDHMRSEWLRVTTFQTFPSDVGISSVKLTKNGFYYTGQNKETKCHFCSKTYNEWTSTSDIEAIHRQISPDCPFINGRETNNIPIHTSSNPSANQEGIFGNLQGGVIERLRINEESVHEETVGAETVGASVSSLTLSQDQIEQLPPSLPTPDRPEGKPPPTTALLTEARETDIKESSLQKPGNSIKFRDTYFQVNQNLHLCKKIAQGSQETYGHHCLLQIQSANVFCISLKTMPLDLIMKQELKNQFITRKLIKHKFQNTFPSSPVPVIFGSMGHDQKQKGGWFKPGCRHLMLCVMPLDAFNLTKEKVSDSFTTETVFRMVQ